MNAYEELAGYRFGSGRDYDKRSVETYRARVLNLVDELLNQLTQLQDEVADLRDRSRIAPAESLAAPPAVAPVVPTTWLEALAATGEVPAEPDDDHAAAAAVTPPAFPAPAVASWLDGTHDADDEGIFGSTAGSTAELLLAAAGNAVAVQAAAVAGAEAPAAVVPAPVASAAAVTKPLPVVPPPPVAAPMRAPSPARPPIPAPTLPPAAPPAPPPPAVDGTPLVVTPGDEVVTAPVGAIERLPIVLDDGLPDDPPLPTPMRHWGGWMR